MDVLQNGQEEWDAIDEHDVNAKSDISVMFHDLLRDVICHSAEDSL
jgi:hypothetical protein